MLEAARKLRNRKLVWSCYTARASALTGEGFDNTVQFFDTLGEEMVVPPPVELPEVPAEEPKPVSREQEKYAIMAAFAKDKRINRTVQVH